jgi:hypothetical protein
MFLQHLKQKNYKNLGRKRRGRDRRRGRDGRRG